MAASRSFTLILVALVAAMATAFVPGNAASRGSGELFGDIFRFCMAFRRTVLVYIIRGNESMAAAIGEIMRIYLRWIR